MSVLIIEDNVSLATLISMYLSGEGIENEVVHNGFEGMARLNEREYDVLLTDIRLPKISGTEIFEKAKTLYPDMPVIIMTAFGNIPDAVKAMRDGAYDYITKPFENDDLLKTIKKAIEVSSIRKENSRLKQYMKDVNTPRMAGHSPAYLAMIKLADTVAPTDAPVLITGESGTGKELTARYIHGKSRRADKQFIAVNCAAIPEQLFESELFGHKKGAFTGADRDFKGRIAEAEGGTLFLDEIGEMPITVQVKLLRFLQESEIQPVGAGLPVKVNTRVIAATNKDLKSMSEKGTFREDLYYRLNVFPVEVPQLSRRREDIAELVELFSKKYGSKVTFSAEALSKLENAQWKGNIRELENTVYRICILKGQGVVAGEDVPTEASGDFAYSMNMVLPEDGLDLEEMEKTIIARALIKFGGNKSRTAKYLNIPRHVLLYRLEKYDME
ncbi:sigma-54-dependent transcriptional regulator [Seleniivibrio woodruffii]|uniref:Two-component system NtrC family response regulator n=1 Tax=Seleniivibrio woodruffii TaxID=1078050 RepID=A0A4R1K9J2_9BACT|nr:sigma-54 dependent transcriptional regulator [Seleniivibrio woodruffii]TCK61024.1 two-component system NtrC family response regulator [Seleniivibrio woodruffii]TVZ36654.1 two-component system NtrC family response regulator [Seleniivibrio woodruffii]